MQKVIDLNADLGESYGAWSMGDDSAMLDIVSSANIACGFHAGGPEEMTKTIQLCREKSVASGAHPGFDDLRGFGRRRLPITDTAALQAQLIYQVGAFIGIATAQGANVSHIKIHGALSNMACDDQALADICVQAFRQVAPRIPVLAQAATPLETAASGGPLIREVFADREYNADGTLVARGVEGAVIHDSKRAAERVLAMIETQSITSVDGKTFAVSPESVCVHGDNPSAVKMAADIRLTLENAGIQIAAPNSPKR
ncbi:MAG: 5-oxoprolinase subunit PxpA [Granulosicoccus sp.]|nr:5-oxoprolinase subunit PxpA [Granulosicoccus sp.]